MSISRIIFGILFSVSLIVGACAGGLADAQGPASSANLDVNGARIANANDEPGNWLSHGRTYDEQRFSPMKSINDDNVDELGYAWTFPTEMGRGHEASPIVVDGVMFLTLPWSKVLALNAKTGEKIWEYDPEVPGTKGKDACCDVVNRGLAIWQGNVYLGTIDGRLVALDAKTGSAVWDVQTTDTDRPYTITGAPRVVKDKVIIGNGGAELGVRGYITAYDAETGEEEWRFYTVPGNPDLPFEHPELEAAAETWKGAKWWEIGGGGTAWDSMAYDPELDLLYVGTGNGSPWNREIRSPGGGDNLYLSSILAIEPDSGRLKWHYQTTPRDNWDYTATQHIVLADMDLGGRERKVLMQAPKNGFFYVLDRDTGELLSADNYVPVTWASHVDMETGRPQEIAGDYSKAPAMITPSPAGGHNWQPMSYSPQTNLVYIPTLQAPFLYVNKADFEYVPGRWNLGVDLAALAPLADMPTPPPIGALQAWDPVAKKTVWEVVHTTSTNGGVLSTAGNLVFQGTGDGLFAAYSAKTGEKLWESQVNVGIMAPPITYSVDGEQYIGVLAGWGGIAITGTDAGLAAGTTYINSGHMLAYKLGGNAPGPKVEARRFTTIPEPPASDASPATLKLGERLFFASCMSCHGTVARTSGVVSDLRYLSKAGHGAFNRIVLEGLMEASGMPKFDDIYDSDEVDAIHAYIISRAKRDREAQLNPNAKKPASPFGP